MGMAAILFNSAKQFEQIVKTVSTDDLMWNLMKSFQRRRHLKFTHILHVYNPRTRVDNPGDHNCDCNLKNTALIIQRKFQPFVFNTLWENVFQQFLQTNVWRGNLTLP